MKQFIVIALLLFAVGLASNVCYADSSPPTIEVGTSFDVDLTDITSFDISLNDLELQEGRIAVYHSDLTYWPSDDAIKGNQLISNIKDYTIIHVISLEQRLISQWCKNIVSPYRHGAGMKELLSIYSYTYN